MANYLEKLGYTFANHDSAVIYGIGEKLSLSYRPDFTAEERECMAKYKLRINNSRLLFLDGKTVFPPSAQNWYFTQFTRDHCLPFSSKYRDPTLVDWADVCVKHYERSYSKTVSMRSYRPGPNFTAVEAEYYHQQFLNKQKELKAALDQYRHDKAKLESFNLFRYDYHEMIRKEIRRIENEIYNLQYDYALKETECENNITKYENIIDNLTKGRIKI